MCPVCVSSCAPQAYLSFEAAQPGPERLGRVEALVKEVVGKGATATISKADLATSLTAPEREDFSQLFVEVSTLTAVLY